MLEGCDSSGEVVAGNVVVGREMVGGCDVGDVALVDDDPPIVPGTVVTAVPVAAEPTDAPLPHDATVPVAINATTAATGTKRR